MNKFAIGQLVLISMILSLSDASGFFFNRKDPYRQAVDEFKEQKRMIKQANTGSPSILEAVL